MNHNKKHLGLLLKRKGIREYNEAVGGLGLPSKMPGYAWGISAKECPLGRTLVKREGSVCHECYALKANYRYPSVEKSHAKRLATLRNLEAWTENMSRLLEELGKMLPKEELWFRFHDSGDLQGVMHLHAIVQVAKRNPEWRFWIPTREYGSVRKYLEQYDIPSNLVVRLSALWVGKEPPANRPNLPTSTVGVTMWKCWNPTHLMMNTWHCPARNQGNACGTCRACWNPEVINVNYKKH